MSISVLYFGQSNRRYALDLIGAYSDGFARRILPGFDNIEAEATAAAETLFRDRMNQLAGFDGPDEDEGFAADDAQEHGFSVYSDLEFVRRQVTGLAIAGLYHLWERLLKEFLVREFGQFNPPIVPREKVLGAEFRPLVGMLKNQGWEIAKESFYLDLDVLRLVVNVVKHGDGKSCQALLTQEPGLFMDFGHPWANKGRGADDLRLTGYHFIRFVGATRAFFERFPERLPSPPTSQCEESRPKPPGERSVVRRRG